MDLSFRWEVLGMVDKGTSCRPDNLDNKEEVLVVEEVAEWGMGNMAMEACSIQSLDRACQRHYSSKG